jgi:hypothetical protein
MGPGQEPDRLSLDLSPESLSPEELEKAQAIWSSARELVRGDGWLSLWTAIQGLAADAQGVLLNERDSWKIAEAQGKRRVLVDLQSTLRSWAERESSDE